MDELEEKIKLDRAINLKCMEDEIRPELRTILRLWIKYDEELLAIIRKEKYENK